MTKSLTGFLLGNYPSLAALELKAVLRRYRYSLNLQSIHSHLLTLAAPVDFELLISQLGGTVKIGEIEQGTLKELSAKVVADLISQNQNQACFQVWGSLLHPKLFAQQVKKACIGKDIKLRFRLPPKPTSTAGVGEAWADYILFPGPSHTLYLFMTRAVHNIAHWSLKDYSRPAISPDKGMLPPKIARMLVNLGIGSKEPSKLTLLDPFCGTGTILLEALDLNCLHAYGSDIAPKQVDKAQRNCRWFCDARGISQSRYTCFVSDVMDLTLKNLKQPVEAVVFEGYLGPPQLTFDKIPGLVKGLVKMYTGVFKRLPALLKPGSRVVCALPAFTDKSGTAVTLKTLIDTCEKLGYTLFVPPLIVGRGKAIIKREILILKYQGNPYVQSQTIR